MWPSEVEILGVGFPKKIPGFNGLSIPLSLFTLIPVLMTGLVKGLVKVLVLVMN